MTIAWVPFDIRNLSHSSDRTATMDSSVEVEGPTPDRAKNDGRTRRQPSVSPEVSRRKRLSLFNRSSDTSSMEPPTLHPTMSSHDGNSLLPPSSTLRPHSSCGRKPSDHLERFRDSLFGGRRNSSLGRPSSRSSQVSTKSYQSQSMESTNLNSDLVPFAETPKPKQTQDGQSFKSAREYYHHRKKSSISPPFNFQHVTHTAKKHIAKLDTVDEKELKHKFWALNTHQKPKEKLHGIKVEDLEIHRERSLSPGARAALPARPRKTSDASLSIIQQTLTRSLDETLFDETQETKFDPDDAYRSLEDVDKSPVHILSRPSPKHCSSMSALNSSPIEPRLRSHSSFDSNPIRESYPLRTRASSLATSTPAPEKSSSLLLRRQIAGLSYHEKAPLPPVPSQADNTPTAEPKNSLDTVISVSPAPSVASYSLFPAPPGTKMEPSNSERSSKRSSKQSTNSIRASSASKSPASRMTDIISETSWEDDVDFAYEQAAEAMSDFDWEHTSRLEEIDEDEVLTSADRTTPEDNENGGVRLSAWMEQPAGSAAETSAASTKRSSGYASSVQSNVPSNDHKRGSSVGHKGFLAARSASENVISKGSPPFSGDASGALSKTPPPKFSVTDSDMEAGNYPSPYNSSTLHFPPFDNSIPEELSDPESPWNRESRHRTSSSYGSFDSSGRSLQTLSDTTRWSLASTSSMPDLVHGKSKSRSSGIKSRMSRPLASVPGSPDNETEEPQDEDSLTVPSQDSILMRRPTNAGDRQVLYSAGRTVQRGRSSTPNRSLVVLSKGTPEEQQASDEAGWI